MLDKVLTVNTCGITAMKSPSKIIEAIQDAPVTILNHNKPSFVAMSTAHYAALLEQLEDVALLRIAKERSGDPIVEVNLDDL